MHEMQKGDEYELTLSFGDVKGWYIDQTIHRVDLDALPLSYLYGRHLVTQRPVLRPQTARSQPLRQDLEGHPEIQTLCMTLTGH